MFRVCVRYFRLLDFAFHKKNKKKKKNRTLKGEKENERNSNVFFCGVAFVLLTRSFNKMINPVNRSKKIICKDDFLLKTKAKHADSKDNVKYKTAIKPNQKRNNHAYSSKNFSLKHFENQGDFFFPILFPILSLLLPPPPNELLRSFLPSFRFIFFQSLQNKSFQHMTSKKNEDDNFQQHRPSSPAISASGGSAALGGGIASRRAFGSASSSSSATSFESFSDQEGGAGGAGGYGFGSDYASGGVGGGGGGNRSFSAQGMRREASFIPKIKSFFSRALQNFTASGKKDSDPFARGGLLVDKSKPNIKKIALIAIVSIVSILLLYFVFGFLFSSSASSSSSSSSSSATYSSFSPNRNREANQKQQQQEQAQKQQQQRQEREREQPETPEPPPVLEERDPKLTFNFPKRKHQTYVPLYRELIQRQEFERNIIYRKRMSDEGKDLGEEIQVTQQLLINRKTAALASIFVPICASTGSQPYLGDTSSIFSSHLENGLEPAKSRIV